MIRSLISSFRSREAAQSRRANNAGSPADASSAGILSEASSSAPASRAGVRPHERRLCGYLMARAALRCKIDDVAEIRRTPDGKTLKSENVLQDLRAANDTVEESRRLLPHGRGNVKSDILATRGEVSRICQAKWNLEENYLEKKGPLEIPEHRFETWAETAAALICGEATCGGSALVAVHVHAPKLKEGQTVRVVQSLDVDHTWADSIRKGAEPGNHPILDRWASGPAVLREDSSFGRFSDFKVGYDVDAKDGKKCTEGVERILKEMKGDRGLMARYKADLKQLKREGFRFPGKVWDEVNVLRATFRVQAAEILRPEPSLPPYAKKILRTDKDVPALPFGQEVLAVGVARSLGEGLRGAVTKAPGIVDAAKRMFPVSP
ncbi:MAG TPA: hypothetical protein VK465_00160 [Fibrobacteria bacterium]|nr:hypothetical protein [Fibrobacteria bacterium]